VLEDVDDVPVRTPHLVVDEPKEPPVMRLPESRFRRDGPVIPDTSIVSVTIDLRPERSGVFKDWRPTEAEVRRLIRLSDEVDDKTWGMVNRTYGELLGTLKLADGRTIEWQWDTGGSRLTFPDGTKVYLVANTEWYRSESRGR